MKRKKLLIWIVGGMASGKSTLRDAMINLLKTSDGVLHSDDKYEYVDYGRIAVVGNSLKTNQCNGLDSSFGKLKKDGALMNTEHCIKNYGITLLEGSQTSAQWVFPLCEMCINHNAEFVLVHLNLRLWENFKRLRNRIVSSGKTESDITDNKIKSVAGKNSQAELICGKCKQTEFVNVICIDTEGMNSDDILLEVFSRIF